MTRRGWFLAGVVGLMVVGCARPGAGDGSTEEVSPAPSAASPAVAMAACFDIHAAPSANPSATAATPLPTGDGPGDQFERNQRANNAFRERRELPAFYYAGAEPCVVKVRAELAKLSAQGRYDAESVEAALRSVGLSQAYARKPGRLDLGSHTGVVFAASPGVGCIVGHHGPDDTTVDFGGVTADGGCLVAAD
jgi:hypothetical protein